MVTGTGKTSEDGRTQAREQSSQLGGSETGGEVEKLQKRRSWRTTARHLIPSLVAVGLLFAHAGCVATTNVDDDERVSEQSEELTRKCGVGTTVSGLDIAMFEGDVDFAKVRASGQRFIIARTNDGNYVDPKFVSYYRSAKAAGLLVGAYMFYRVGLEHDRPGHQASVMLSQLAAAGYDKMNDLPPTLDVENATFNRALGTSVIVREMRAVLDALEARAGKKPMIYTNASWDDNVGQATFGAYPLWAAQYNNNGSAASNCPSVAATGARTWTFWQHCMGEAGAGQCARAVPGVTATRPDQNVFNGSMADLMAFVHQGHAAPPSPPEGTPATLNGCHSETLNRDVPENTCVQSRSDNAWYQCSGGEWLDRSSVAAACVSEHPL